MKRVTSLIISALCFVASFGAFAQSYMYGNQIAGPWHGELKLGVNKLSIVFHLGLDKEGKRACYMDSPDQNVKGIPTKILFDSSDSLSIDIPMIGASFQGRLKNDKIIGIFRQSGMSFDLTLNPGSIVKNRPQTPMPPFPYKTEEVLFSNNKAGVTLSGTLTYPVNYDQSGKNTPIVVLVSGSGIQNRDEELFEHKPFAVIADYLAKNGIASLRYDDRGYGAYSGDPKKSTGDVTNSTTYDFKEDAEAGLEFIKNTGSFGKRGVIGHSEGGAIAFMLGSSPDVDFVISMAGPGVRGDSLLVEQNYFIFKSNGASEMQSEDYCKVLSRILKEKVINKTIPEPENLVESLIKETGVSLPEALIQNLITVAGMNSPWMDNFISYSPIRDIEGIRCPVMAINGTEDIQVVHSTNLTSVKRHLPDNPRNLVKEYKGLNHLFQHSIGGGVNEYAGIEETISEEVLADMVNWITTIVNGY